MLALLNFSRLIRCLAAHVEKLDCQPLVGKGRTRKSDRNQADSSVASAISVTSECSNKFRVHCSENGHNLNYVTIVLRTNFYELSLVIYYLIFCT